MAEKKVASSSLAELAERERIAQTREAAAQKTCEEQARHACSKPRGPDGLTGREHEAKTVAEANPELLKAIEEARRASEVSGAS